MKNSIVKVFTLVILSWILIAGCDQDPAIDMEIADEDIVFKIPQGFPQPVYQFQNNTLSKEGFKLGRKLFYDGRLSKDNTISCGFCHQQFAAFANFDHKVSHGINSLLGTRNAPPMFNLVWHPTFMWDGGINHIEVQPLAPITNPVEMDETLDNIVVKLQADAVYRQLFKEAFGDETINSQRIFKALAQFMGMLNSYNSRYDKYVRGEPGGNMTSEELDGLSLFRQKCSSCHTEPLFTDFSYRNNGLRIDTNYKDIGRMHITGLLTDSLKFKVPTLRNIDLTMPYMHDGRFNTLSQVLDHYISGIHTSTTLDAQLTNGIPLTTIEKQNIIRFLQTLSDYEFITDPRFSENSQ